MEIIVASIVESNLWSHFKIYTLKQNMRVLQTDLSEAKKKTTSIFSSWLLDIGDGKLGTPDQSDPQNASWIKIPDDYCIPDDENGLSELIKFIYDKDTLQKPSAQQLQQKVTESDSVPQK